MLFKLFQFPTLQHGKLDTDRQSGLPVIVDRIGSAYFTFDVDFVVPDDELQADRIRAAGFKVHTPMSMQLGAGSTNQS